jgi:hypothetical protein
MKIENFITKRINTVKGEKELVIIKNSIGDLSLSMGVNNRIVFTAAELEYLISELMDMQNERVFNHDVVNS